MLALLFALFVSAHGSEWEALSEEVAPDPIFIAYATYVGLVLAMAGLVLLVVGLIRKKEVSRIADTYASWLVMAPAVLGALWLGRVATIVAIGLLSVFGFKEFARATGLYRDWYFTVAVYLGVLGLSAASLMTDHAAARHGHFGAFMAAPVFVIATLVAIPVLRNESRGQLQRVSLSIVGFLYFGWMFGHLGYLANADHGVGYLLFLLFAVPISDVAAFVFGRLFGKRELRSRVSPEKTIEGSLGSLAVSMVLPWALRFSFPHFETTELILTGLIVGLGGQLGDLSISFIKRDLGIKDMGAAIPGHGGVLDRVDSLILVAPLFLHMVRSFHGL